MATQPDTQEELSNYESAYDSQPDQPTPYAYLTGLFTETFIYGECLLSINYTLWTFCKIKKRQFFFGFLKSMLDLPLFDANTTTNFTPTQTAVVS